MKTYNLYIIKLRGYLDTNLAVSESDDNYQAYNTLKFESVAGAVAYARKRFLDPRDFVIVKSEFTAPKILEVIEIDYSTSEISVTSKE